MHYSAVMFFDHNVKETKTMGHELTNNASVMSPENVDALVLYNSPASPCARRVRISLLEKGLSFDTVEMNLITMEQRSEEYLALNPNGYVPTLTHGEQVIYDSKVINEYLEEQFPDRPLMPKSDLEKAQVRAWIAAEEDFSKVFRPLLYQTLMGPIQHISRSLAEAETISLAHTKDPKDLAWAKQVWQLNVLTKSDTFQHQTYLLTWLDKLDKALENKGFLVGKYLSQADISLFPRVEMMSYLGIHLDEHRYANLLDWLKRLSQRTAFQDSMSAQGKKLASLANSKLMEKTRKVLSIEQSQRRYWDKTFLWGFGRLIRKLQKVEQQLSPKQVIRDLPLPKQGRDIQFNYVLCGQKEQDKTTTLTLYGPSSAIETKKVLLVARYLGVALTHEKLITDSPKNSLDQARLTDTNQVAIKVGNSLITHASTICEYLCDFHASPCFWLNQNSLERAKVRMWLALEQGTNKEFDALTPSLDSSFNKQVLSKQDEAHYLNRIQQKCKTLNDALLKSRYLVGESITLADLIWFVRLQDLKHYSPFSMSDHGALLTWYDALTLILTDKVEHKDKQEPVSV